MTRLCFCAACDEQLLTVIFGVTGGCWCSALVNAGDAIGGGCGGGVVLVVVMTIVMAALLICVSYFFFPVVVAATFLSRTPYLFSG